MRYYFDANEFSKRIKTKRIIELKVDLLALSKKTKVSPATMSRLENGKTPEIETFLKMCNWLDALPREFIVTTLSKSKK